MFCSKCGEEIKNDAKFCSKCGQSIHGDPSLKSLFNVKLMCIVGGILVIAILLILFLGKERKLSKQEIISAMTEQQVTSMRIGEITEYFNIDEVKNITYAVDENDQEITCNIIMSNEIMRVEAQYALDFTKVNDSWILSDYTIIKIEDVQLLSGVELSNGLVEYAIKELYPDIHWDLEQYSIIGNDINYKFPIEWVVEERNTDLDNKQDQVICNYGFFTNTAYITGKIELNYIFSNDEGWILNNVVEKERNITWDLEGVWSFEIYTYYVEVAILYMDWENHIATIGKRGSLFQGSGIEEIVQVGFQSSDEYIYFNTFTISRDSMWSSDEEITLTVKLDDMYYKHPNIFTGEGSYDLPIGGKSSELEAGYGENNNSQYDYVETQQTSEYKFVPYLEPYTIYSPNYTNQNSSSDTYKTFVIFGVNSTTGALVSGTLARATLIISINESTKQLQIVSIPENALLATSFDDDYKLGKSSSAYNRGVLQANNMINRNMDLAVDDFITIGFEGIIQLVDGVGGVWIYIDEDELEAINADSIKYITEEMEEKLVPIETPGYQLLDGVQAATYCMGRLNGVDDKFAMAARQQEVLVAFFEQMLQLDLESRSELLNSVSSNLYTSYAQDEMVSLLNMILESKITGASVFPYEDMSGQGNLGSTGHCIYPIQLEQNVKKLHMDLYGVANYEVSSEVEKISNSIYEFVLPYIQN